MTTKDVYAKRAQQQREQEELDAALAAWIEGSSSSNSRRLYNAACAYLGAKPSEYDYDNAPRDLIHGGKLTAEMAAARIKELEGDISVLKLQLAARMCSDCPQRERVAELERVLKIQSDLINDLWKRPVR